MKPFEFINNILSSKHHAFAELEGSYSQWLINRGLSYHYDTVMFAQVVNEKPMDDDVHYEFLHHAVPKAKRKFAKWHKPPEVDDLELIQEAYGVNRIVAQQYLQVLNTTDGGMDRLRELLYKGGSNAQ